MAQQAGHDEVALMGELAEFRQALRDEIDAAKRNESGSAVSLTDGRLLARIADVYQYRFSIENVLNLPGDAPGELRVPGRPPCEVAVISVVGMTITLGVPVDLGRFVANAQLQSNMAFLLRKLIDRIEGIADTPNTAGDRILGKVAVAGLPETAPVDESNAEQASAVASSLGRDTTFIWGPPGTGKTRTIGAIGHQLYERGRAVLVVSHTNTAVDHAVLQIAERVRKAEGGQNHLAEGRVIRVGEPQAGSKLCESKNGDLLVKTHADRKAESLAKERRVCEAERRDAAEAVLDLNRRIDLRDWVDHAGSDMAAMAAELEAVRCLEGDLVKARATETALAAESGRWASAADAAHRAAIQSQRLAGLNDQREEAVALASSAQRDSDSAARDLAKADELYAETLAVGWLTRKWRGLPQPEAQRVLVSALTAARDQRAERLRAAMDSLSVVEREREACVSALTDFRAKHGGDPMEVVERAAAHKLRLAEASGAVVDLARRCSHRRSAADDRLAQWAVLLCEWGLMVEEAGTPEETLAALYEAYAVAGDEAGDEDLPAMRNTLAQLNSKIRSLDARMATIDEAMRRVEELVIANAAVVATTLTRAYLRDSIWARRFDTVILDEASMAPIPSLWVAGALATSNAVVVGDPKQLPPIVISESEMARKWLGRDIFDVAGFGEPDALPPHVIELREQYRMHPQISAIPNAMIYDGKLRDASDVAGPQADAGLLTWYRSDWGHDQPVLLADTGPLDAWVTSVARGKGSSRLNFLSATVCVDIAQALLGEDRKSAGDGETSRILIACPYRPHARLLSVLLREQGLERDAKAGTAHSFQGSEADVVILDLVNDEPHWRVGMFVPEHEEQAKRLLNVALTRARRRLIVVGEFDYIAKQASKAFLGRDLVPFLLARYTRIDAREAVPAGFAARAAKAQRTTFGGEVEEPSERSVGTQERFFPALLQDFTHARRRIVIYSPFITQRRLEMLQAAIRGAVERAVAVYVVTKSREDRSRGELPEYRSLERALRGWGVVVIHKARMHEKLVFVDDDILWSGSLNPLSFSNTQEIMERRDSAVVTGDYARTLLLDELLAEYPQSPSCPICGSEVVAAEGREAPFYWTCVVRGCYSRNVGDPGLVDGAIVCQSKGCGQPVEYGDWGGEPSWRCVANPRHHQHIIPAHLRLPKMRALVPKHDLARVEKLLGHAASRSGDGGEGAQGRLFD